MDILFFHSQWKKNLTELMEFIIIIIFFYNVNTCIEIVLCLLLAVWLLTRHINNK
jgi:hypothetical protein